MERYKPGYLGKVIPADNPSKLSDFVNNKYDAFSKVYDTCKEQSEQITDIKVMNDKEGEPSLTVKISASEEVIERIKEDSKDDKSVIVTNDVITATVTP